MLQGLRLGTVAHLIALRRSAIGDVSVEDAWPLDDLVQTINTKRWGSESDEATQALPTSGNDQEQDGNLEVSKVSIQQEDPAPVVMGLQADDGNEVNASNVRTQALEQHDQQQCQACASTPLQTAA